jgi:hypothetical protein
MKMINKQNMKNDALFSALSCLPAIRSWENMADHEKAEELYSVSHMDVSLSDTELSVILEMEVRGQHIAATVVNKPRRN